MTTDLPSSALLDAVRRHEQTSVLPLRSSVILDTLKREILPTLAYIPLIFPEYTPHGETYHINHLFVVADHVIGREVISALNAAEALILASGIYAHDWGMAVSQLEKQYIYSSFTSTHTNFPDTFWTEHEPEQFARYISKLTGQPRGTADTADPYWPTYVRDTHADRSAHRVRAILEQLDQGLADAVSKVCAAHWLDYKALRDESAFPQDLSVMRHSVNLQALAIYLRLIDLFDIGDDRTPFVLWKYVSPRDPAASIEWRKHRAIRPVVSNTLPNGRQLVVDGYTDDHEVFASLQDSATIAANSFKTAERCWRSSVHPRIILAYAI